jgi:hypothetical protein
MAYEKNDALKDYVEVNVRIERFWAKYPNGRIETQVTLLPTEPQEVLIKADVYREIGDAVPAATGHAHEVKGSSYINKTSFIENCYHRSTEVLTDTGWKNIVDITTDDYVAQVDLNTNALIFRNPNRIITQEGQTFLRIEDNLTCQIVTPEHYVIIDNQKIMAKDVIAKRNNRPTTYNIKHDFNHDLSGRYIKESDGFIKILQWIIADGHVDFEHRHIKFGFVKKRKFDRLIDLLEQEDCGYTTSYNPENGIRRINIKQGDSERFIQYLPGRKTLDFYMAIEMTNEQAKAFIEEVQFTDGYCHKDGIYLRQTDKEYFDNLNFLALKAGYCVASPMIDDERNKGSFANGQPIYRARYKHYVRRMSVEIEQLKGTDTAYCVETETGTVVTRNNMKITVSSNCETSAVGRALAILGFEIKKSVASREEVANAQQQQRTAPTPTPAPDKPQFLEHQSPYPTDSQIKMLAAKITQSGYFKKDSALVYQVIGQHLGYEIKQLLEIKKSDVTKVAEFLTNHKKEESA